MCSLVQSANVQLKKNGAVDCNEHLQSVTAPHIYCAGDSTFSVGLVSVAEMEGRFVSLGANSYLVTIVCFSTTMLHMLSGVRATPRIIGWSISWYTCVHLLSRYAVEHMAGDPKQMKTKLSYNNVSSIMFLKPEACRSCA